MGPTITKTLHFKRIPQKPRKPDIGNHLRPPKSVFLPTIATWKTAIFSQSFHDPNFMCVVLFLSLGCAQECSQFCSLCMTQTVSGRALTFSLSLTQWLNSHFGLPTTEPANTNLKFFHPKYYCSNQFLITEHIQHTVSWTSTFKLTDSLSSHYSSSTYQLLIQYVSSTYQVLIKYLSSTYPVLIKY